MSDRRRVVVVGGGISGLATAWYLRSGASGVVPDVALLEASGRLGGKIRTDEMAGVPVEAGPDTFLARVPWAIDLCRELGLGDDLVAPATTKAYVLAGGRLRVLPRDHVLGVPLSARQLQRSKILTPAGLARAGLDLVLPRQPRPPDPSVAQVIGERFGPQLLDRLVEPLVGGINAGRADRLSMAATARPLAQAASRHRSLVVGLRAERRRSPPPTGPVFLGVGGGLERLVDRLAAHLEPADVRVDTPVAAVEKDAGGAVQVHLEAPAADGSTVVEADAVVLATPAFVTARLLENAAATAAGALEEIRYASVAVATLAYRPPGTPSYLDGSGFLVPRTEGRLMTACTWSTSKWPELRRGGHILVRASAGRVDDERALELDDGELVKRFHAELSQIIGVDEPPVLSSVSRWPRSFPQYEVGHEDRVERVRAGLSTVPGVFVTGATYRGLGIASCIQQAEHTAGEVLTYLSHS